MMLRSLVCALLLVAADAAAADFQNLAENLVGVDQGVFVEAEDGRVLAAVQARRPFHPASLSKIPTTLALLEALGPEYRFATKILHTGGRDGAAVDGDLLIRGGGDPYLISESGLLIAAALKSRGIAKIRGRVRVEGPLFFNWHEQGTAALVATITGSAGEEAFAAARALDPELVGTERAELALAVAGADLPKSSAQSLFAWQSPPLRRILKELNTYSNNIFEPTVRVVGGKAMVQQAAQRAAPDLHAEEIRIDNAAGLGRTNRLSPRAVVALLAALEARLAASGLLLRDVLPVAGVDPGTLAERFVAPELRGVLVAKTGTIPSQRVSALAGVINTERYGRVRFAILNHTIPVQEARRRQDALVAELVREAGGVPLPYVVASKSAISAFRLE